MSASIAVSDLPKCPKCSSLTRPGVVWFHERLDEDVLKQCGEHIENCDLCLLVYETQKVVHK
jgi:NAD-dependent SIR2 family protein deacetylase